MSDFKAKMHHQIRFPLGLCPIPRGGLTALPQPLAACKGPSSKRSEEGGEGNGVGERGEREKG